MEVGEIGLNGVPAQGPVVVELCQVRGFVLNQSKSSSFLLPTWISIYKNYR